MLLLEQREHSILKTAKEAKREGRKLYIYGAAEAGVSVFHALQDAGITSDGFCVDEAYYQPGRSKCGLPIVCLDNFIGGGYGVYGNCCVHEERALEGVCGRFVY